MEELRFKLETFEGPLDLLLTLITRNKVSIYDIPISFIFDQYMDYLRQMEMMDMEIAGEFITMAAELMLIKSRMLLPKPETEKEDPREQLAQALAEYKKAKEASVFLRERYEKYHGRITKDAEVLETEEVLLPHETALLEKAFANMMRRSREVVRQLVKPETALGNLLAEAQEVVPVPQKIYGIMRRLAREGEAGFDEIIETSRSRSEMVASFMALLELLRAGRILIVEDPQTDGMPETENAADSSSLRFRLNRKKGNTDDETSESGNA